LGCLLRHFSISFSDKVEKSAESGKGPASTDGVPIVTSLLFLELSKAGHDDDGVLLRTVGTSADERPLAN